MFICVVVLFCFSLFSIIFCLGCSSCWLLVAGFWMLLVAGWGCWLLAHVFGLAGAVADLFLFIIDAFLMPLGAPWFICLCFFG